MTGQHIKSSFTLGLSVSRRATGFTILRNSDGNVARFGLIDHEKKVDNSRTESYPSRARRNLISTNESDSQRNAIVDTLKKIQFALSQNNEHENNPDSITCVGLEDALALRSFSNSRNDVEKQIEASKLQGMLISDFASIFKNVIVEQIHPREARIEGILRLLQIEKSKPVEIADEENNTFEKDNIHQRKRMSLKLTSSEVTAEKRSFLTLPNDKQRLRLFRRVRKAFPELPQLSTNLNKLDEKSLVVSDAWASANLARIKYLMNLKRNDSALIERIENDVRKNDKRIRQLETGMRGGIDDYSMEPEDGRSSINSELHDILNRQLDFAVDARLKKMVGACS